MADQLFFIKKRINTDESYLIDQLYLKNEKAFAVLYRNYSSVLSRCIRKKVNCTLVSEEIMQNVFLKTWMHIDEYSREKGSLYTWMKSIAQNESVDYLRSKQAKYMRITTYGNEIDLNKEPTIKMRFEYLDLIKSLSLLPPKERTILELYNIGYTCKEVSGLLSLPEGTVKTNMRKSYKKLRAILT